MFWAADFVLAFAAIKRAAQAARYFDGLNFTEPGFVFVEMVAAARPVVGTAERIIAAIAARLPGPESRATVGPLNWFTNRRARRP